MWREGQWEAEAFHSRQLRGAEQRYSATELEAFTLVSTIQHFGYYLYGREFVAFTDHKPLCQLMTSDRLNPRLRRLSFKLQHWLMKAEYLPGDKNGVVQRRAAKDDVSSSSDSGRQSCLGGCGGSNPHMKNRRAKPCKGEYPGMK